MSDSITEIDDTPSPCGQLTLQTMAMPKDTNANGDIISGWLVSQMDLAGNIAAGRIAEGRVATVSIDRMGFMVPVKVGDVVSCYAETISVGHSSIRISIEVWTTTMRSQEPVKVTDGIFVVVAIDKKGRTRAVPKSE